MENQALELNTYTISSQRLPTAFDGFRIAQVSDLHNAEMGENNEKLLTTLHEAKPDIIVLTGDLIDSRKTKVDVALDFVENAMQIAPCYYVTGNHEARVQEYTALKEGLTSLGVEVLENARTEVELSGEKITILGVDDPSVQTDYLFGDEETVMRGELSTLTCETDGFTILLSHRPELFDIYVEFGVDVVFSGHAHGGQFRLPFVGGMFAPNQGLFPNYDGGVFTQDKTNMVVSRGVGNSIIPFRINNKPEVVLIELTKEV
ncbi:MAG: metallophosphoesterase [Clostridia bacterium]|nr:metallophosphoesterase [Clostridia bacterium]